MEAPLVVAICGSRRTGSYTRKALEIALDGAEAAGAETELVDLRTADVPLYDPDADAAEMGDVADLMELVERADGVIVGSPVYHSSYSSTFKNFHDFCGSDEFEETVCGLLATAGGSNYEGTLEHMRATMRGVHAFVIPRQVGIAGASRAFDDDGNIPDEGLEERVLGLGEEVVEYACRLARPCESVAVE